MTAATLEGLGRTEPLAAVGEELFQSF